MSNTPNTIRDLLYTLKREYGNYATLCKRVVNGVDLATGVKNITETIYELPRTIILPSKLLTKFFQLGRLPEFKYGGDIDLEKRMLIIDEKDLPQGIVSNIGTEDYFFIKHKRYIVVEAEEWEDNSAYLVLIQEAKNVQSEQTIILKVTDFINLKSGFGSIESIIDTLSLNDSVVNS